MIQKQAIEYATQVLSDGKQDGFIDDYRYVTYAEENRIRITFLNCEQKLKFFYSFLMTSLWIALTGYLLFFAVVVFFSKNHAAGGGKL
ncbi:MAG: hypothetical protein ACLR23_20545 [Clostridia bacterium]